MKYIFWIFCYAIVFKSIYLECQKGCLKCNLENECEFCDGTNNYILDSNGCKKVELENCLIISVTGECVLCAENYYIDQETFKCVELTDSDKVENCRIHASSEICSLCEKGFYVKDGICEEVPAPIQNCLQHNRFNLLICEECDKDYILSLDKKFCGEVTPLDNCSGYSALMCRSCQNDYIKENNMYIELIYKFENESNKSNVLQSLINDRDGIIDQGPYRVCKKKNVDNCAIFSTFNTCEECKDGFVLTEDFKCEPYPKEDIPNCTKYLTATQCIECEEGMHLKDSVCTQDSVIPNCVTYSRTATTTTCLECTPIYYLDDNICKDRTMNSMFDACSKVKITEDVCETCIEGFEVTTDKIGCLPLIENCLEYQTSSINTEKHICLKCKPLYYRESDEKCIVGTVENCYEYKISENKCEVCDNKYYVNDSGNCDPQPDLENCKTYSTITEKACDVCNAESMLFTQVNSCLPKEEEIENCLVYSTPKTCGKCDEGYEIDSSGKCTEIINPANCLIKNNNNCIKCRPDYYIDNSGACIIIEDFFSLECQSHNVDGTRIHSNYECNYCNVGAIPYDYKNSYLCTSSDNIEQKISGCIKYFTEDVGGVIYYDCAMCDNNQVIDDFTACFTSCEEEEAQIVMQGYNTNSSGGSTYDSYSILYNNICESVFEGPNVNCSHLYPDLFNHNISTGEFTYSCAKCNNGFQKIISPEKSIITDNLDSNLYGSSPVDSYPGVNCVANDWILIDEDISLIPNCEYYYNIGEDNYGCYRCKLGYSGEVVLGGYIETCVELSTCDITSKEISGLNTTKNSVMTLKTVWTAIFSCYSCLNALHIPFAAINFADDTKIPKLEPFNLIVNNGAYNSGSGQKAVNCYSIDKINFGISLDENFTFPENCAMGVIDTTKNANASEATNETPDPDKASIFCIACKPGYKPKYVTNNTGLLMVYECKKINESKCISSTWHNSCSNCASGHAYNYNPTTKMVEFDNCEEYDDDNCYAVDITDVAKPQCVYCKKGYSFNVDKKCEMINSSRCKDNQFTFDFKFNAEFSTDQHAIGMILAPNGPGCQECESGFLPLKVQATKYYCTASTYVNDGTYPADTKLIDQCKNYFVDSNGKLACRVCESDYILNTNDICVVADDYPNCEIANVSSGCKKCKANYVNISDNCVLKDIDHCLVYNEESSAQSLTCLQCESGYYSTFTACREGEIPFCKIYANRNECSECQENYALAITKNAQSYCYPIDTKLNCKSISSQISDMEIECNECKFGFALTTGIDDRNKTICMNFRLIAQCMQYEITNDIPTSTFKCLKCKEGFYLDTPLSCKSRTVLHDKCIEYKDLKDRCNTCDDGYYVNPEGSCIENPTGIRGCRTYTNLTTCKNCVTGAFLENNKCIFIDNDRLIPNCLYYTLESECSVCDTGYAISNNSCVTAQAKDCSSYSSPTRCETCPEGYGFKDENGVRNCIKKEIPNCKLSADFFPFRCLICETGYYPNNDSCEEIEAIIEGCNVYDTRNTCSECNPGSVLTADGSSCITDSMIIKLVDPNCFVSFLSQSNRCVKCQKGFLLNNNNNCIECSNNKLSSGCYVCNPYNQDKCMLCAQGFHQNKEGLCVSDNPLDDDGEDDDRTVDEDKDKDDSGEDEDETKSTTLILIIPFLLILSIIK